MNRAKPEHQRKWAAMAEEIAGLGYWRLDTATAAVQLSPGLLAMFGFAPDTESTIALILGRVHPDDCPAFTERLAGAMAGGAGASFFRLLLPGGEERFVEGRYGPERDQAGKLLGILGTVLDVTNRERAVAALWDSEARFRVLADQASDVILRVDAMDTILWVSPSVRRYGYLPGELVGRTGYELVHPDDRDHLGWLIADLFRGQVDPDANREYRIRTADGSWVWFEGSPALLRDEQGKPTEVISILRDVSARKAREQLTNEALETATGAARLKADFLASMSREIRAPLTSIGGLAGLIEAQPEVTATTRGYAQRVQAASEALLSVVDDVIDLGKADTARLTTPSSRVSPAILAADVLSLFEPLALAKGLKLDLRCAPGVPRAVVGDETRLRQVLVNIVGNAMKFTEAGAVSLAVRWLAADRLSFEITDTGPGISPGGLKKLFRRAAQAESSQGRIAGASAHGISISCDLVEAMGGRIGAKSTPGKGSSFWLDIPSQAVATVPE